MASSPSQRLSRLGRRPVEREVGQGPRSWVLILMISALLFGVIPLRLSHLQILEGARNRELADENRIQLIPKRPERGKILDRKGRVLASNQFSYSVFIWPLAQTKPGWPKTVEILSRILKTPADDLNRKVEKAGPNSPSLVRVARGITFSQVVALEEHRSELIGVEIDNESHRYYPHGEMAAQVLGYIGEITGEELDRKKDDGYRLGDVIGKIGIEQNYESELRGTWGGQQVEVDSSGRIVQILGQKPPKPGKDITLTLDLEVQKAAEAALGSRPGAIVALDPRNGAVLAMVSHPAYNPNWFARRMTEAQWQSLQKRSFPFVNRAIQGFPPASTFKIITAAAGMESGKYPPNTVLMTYPSIHGVGAWNGAGFGPLGYSGAMQWSSNTFFGQVAVGIGPEKLLDWAKRFGLGEKTGLDIQGEAEGFLPDPAWKQKVWEDRWYPADSVMMSIGQGAVQVTPLQAAVVFAATANKGYRVVPHLRKSKDPATIQRTSLNLKPQTVSTIRTGMRAVVTSGTGPALNVPTIPPSAGKSGTGEDPPRRSHTWFGAFAPYDKEAEIAVVAFAENSGGGGGSVAGPIVLKVLEAYFKHNPLQ